MNAELIRIVAASSNARPQVVVADWDNTLRAGFSIEGWLSCLEEHGYSAAEWRTDYSRAANALRSQSLSYEGFLAEVAQLYLRAAPESLEHPDAARIADAFVRADRINLFAHTTRLLDLLGRLGATVVLVSGAPGIVLRAYARVLPIAHVIGLASSDTYPPWPGTADFKSRALTGLGLSREHVVLALGDSASDEPLFEVAAMQVVVNNTALRHSHPSTYHLATGQVDQIEAVLSWIVANWPAS